MIWLLVVPFAFGLTVGYATGRGHTTVVARRATEALDYAREELANRKTTETLADRWRRLRPERSEEGTGDA